MKKGVIVECITGEVIFENQKNRGTLSKPLKIKEQTKVIIGKNSYAKITDNPDIRTGQQGSYIILFPESESVIEVKSGFLKEFKIVKGMARVAIAENKKVITPFAEYYGGIAWFEVLENSSTVIADTREQVFVKNLKQMIKIGEKKQILITEKGISEPAPMDEKFFRAEKIIENMGAFDGFLIYKKALEKSDEMLNIALANLKIIAEKTGQNFDELKKDAVRNFENYKKWVNSEMEKSKQNIENIKNFSVSESQFVSVNKELQYKDLNIKIISIKKETKDNDAIKLSIKMKVKNNSQKEHFIFWNEEARVINNKDEIFYLDDYNLSTDLLPGTENEGYLFFNIKNKSDIIDFEIGKRNSEKIKINLTEKEGE